MLRSFSICAKKRIMHDEACTQRVLTDPNHMVLNMACVVYVDIQVNCVL